MSFRYYVYVSNAKVDMLLSQIDSGFNHQRESEISMNVKVAAGKRKVVRQAPDRFAKLERVVEHLREHADIGTFDEPGQFFAGILPMYMVTVEHYSLYVGGSTARTEVALGGAMQHLVGAAVQPSGLGSSMLCGIMHSLDALAGSAETTQAPTAMSQRHVAGIVQANRRLGRRHLQNVEVLAKRLLHVPAVDGGAPAVLVGSPLYLALAD